MTEVSILTKNNIDLSGHNFPPRVDLHIENEIGFLMPARLFSKIDKQSDLYPIQKSIIEQRYFTKNLIPFALKYLQKHSSAEFADYKVNHFSQVRLRRTVPLGLENSQDSTQYELTLKSPKLRDGERIELNHKLAEAEYLEILSMIDDNSKYAQKGYILKERNHMSGVTYSGQAIDLEIDIILAAGNQKKYRQYDKSSHSFVKVGCEAESMSGIRDLIEKQHGIEFLKDPSVLLLSKSNPLSNYMSMSYIASKGINEDKIHSLMAQAA